MKIKKISASEILDSRGNPTIESTVILDDGTVGSAKVPSGASTGKYEAVELRDNDPPRYNGLGVLKAIHNVEEKIAKALVGMDAAAQAEIDATMVDLDGTENKANLGANAILSVSMATACAAAASEKKDLFEYLTKFNPDFDGKYIMPLPQMNVLNGGMHANWSTDIQEYIIFPVGANSIVSAIRMGAEVYQVLKKVITSKGYSVLVGDEGGFAPAVSTNEEPFVLVIEAIEKAGYKPGSDIALGIDAAASEFWASGEYSLKREGKRLSGDELLDFYSTLLKKYPIVSMEDIFDQDDFEAYKKFHAQHNDIQIVGDDLYATNIKRLERGITKQATNSILIKLNQIGTVSETIEAILLARKNGMKSIVSHRSGETEDTFIADFAVAMGVGQIKAGAPARSDRTAKYNRLVQIEAELNQNDRLFSGKM